uniref:EGF-like domain-containing protein n=1 Tax=Hydatigena taeniaeformis TaxID=6205 RepID=A0A0R3WXQ5_HYDTA
LQAMSGTIFDEFAVLVVVVGGGDDDGGGGGGGGASTASFLHLVAVWIKLSMNLYVEGQLVMWEQRNNSEAAISAAACSQLTAAILRGPNPIIATAFVDCDLLDLEKIRVDNEEGIRVTLLLKFDPGNNPKAFQEAEVRRHIESSPFNIDFDADETISINNFDVCKENKHDCSPSANCNWDGVTYTCECNRFFTDGVVMGKLLPGRECYREFPSRLLIESSTLQ